MHRHEADPWQWGGIAEFQPLSSMGLLHRALATARGTPASGDERGLLCLCAFFLFQEKAAAGTETMAGRWSPPQSRASTLSKHAHNRSHLLPHAQRTQASRPWKMGRLQPTLLQSAPQKSTCLLPVHAPSSLFCVVLPGVSSAGPILQWVTDTGGSCRLLPQHSALTVGKAGGGCPSLARTRGEGRKRLERSREQGISLKGMSFHYSTLVRFYWHGKYCTF